jgi:hypothetical protein
MAPVQQKHDKIETKQEVAALVFKIYASHFLITTEKARYIKSIDLGHLP